MNVLDWPDLTVVTGASGWFGRAFVAALTDPTGPYRAAGSVRALVNDPADAHLWADTDVPVDVVVGDVRDPATLRGLFATGGDRTLDLVHAAGVIHPASYDEFEEVNARGTDNVMTAALGRARRVVHVSSNSPFGCNPDRDDRFRDDEPYDPYMGYGHSKMQGELAVQRAVDAGLDAVIVRPPWFYGPFQPARQTTFFTMVRTGRFPILGSGEQRRSMTYIDNLVQGVAAALRTATDPGRAWWIADATPYTINEIVETVGRVLRDEGFRVRPNTLRLPRVVGRLAERADRRLQRSGRYVTRLHVLGEMDKTIACDISGARAELGYEPTVDLAEGMRRSVRWCLESGIEL